MQVMPIHRLCPYPHVAAASGMCHHSPSATFASLSLGAGWAPRPRSGGGKRQRRVLGMYSGGVGDAGLQVLSERCSIPARLTGTTAGLGETQLLPWGCRQHRLLDAPLRELGHATQGWHGNQERTLPVGDQVGPTGRGDHREAAALGRSTYSSVLPDAPLLQPHQEPVTAMVPTPEGDTGVWDLERPALAIARHLLNYFLPIPPGIHFLAKRLSNARPQEGKVDSQDGGEREGPPHRAPAACPGFAVLRTVPPHRSPRHCLTGALQQLLGPSVAVPKAKMPQKAVTWTRLSRSSLRGRANC